MRSPLKKISQFLEFLLFQPILLILNILSFRGGGAFGKWLFSAIGPLLSVNRVGHKNLQIAFPHLSVAERTQILKKMWGHLGQTFFEYVKLASFDPRKVAGCYIEGEAHLRKAIQEQQRQGRPILLFTAHFGQWEMGTHLAQLEGLKVAQVTRFLNNPYMRACINRVHQKVVGHLIPKGPSGAKKILMSLKSGEAVSMLADQKMDNGEEALFFGQKAMTAPAWARLAQKYKVNILPFYGVRTGLGTYKIVYEAPLENVDDVGKTIQAMNDHIESWIRLHPEQYFWLHKRFPKELYRTKKQ